MIGGVDAVLRGGATGRSWRQVVACGMLYGAVMGSSGGRPAQAAVSAAKVPILLLATVALAMPSFFVLNSLLGVGGDFRAAARAVVASQAALAIILASLAPLTAVWYASTSGHRVAILFNAAMFAVASAGSQLLLRRAYRPLIARDPRHRLALLAWLVVYAFVGIQMGWVLRPFIGKPGIPTQLLRPDAWDNAYVEVARMILDVATGRE